MVHRSHVASAFEFFAPLAFALFVLKATTERLGLDSAGVIILLVAIAAFVVNLDVTGGRTTSGFIARLEDEGEVEPFLGLGLLLSLGGAVLVSSAAFSVGYFYIKGISNSAEGVDAITFVEFSLSSILAQVAGFLLWSRLGAGDSAGRSITVIGANVAAVVAIATLYTLDRRRQFEYAIPFLVRDSVTFCSALFWYRRRFRFRTKGGGALWRSHARVSLKALGISLTTALFEPLIKFYIAGAVSLDKLPIFELSQRAFTATRNGIVVFVQTYTPRIVRLQSSQRRNLVIELDYVVGLATYLVLSSGAIALSLIGTHFVAASSQDILSVYIPLLPAVAFSVAVCGRYIALYVNGGVGKLFIVHVVQAALPVFVVLFRREATLSEIIYILVGAYLSGALITLALSWREYGPLGGKLWLAIVATAASFIAVPCVLFLLPRNILPLSGYFLVFGGICFAPLLFKKYKATLHI